MRSIAPDGGRWTTPSAPWLWRQRLHAGRPQAGGGLDADDIGKTGLGDAVTQLGVVAVSCVGQGNFGFNTGGESDTKLVKRDRRSDVSSPSFAAFWTQVIDMTL